VKRSLTELEKTDSLDLGPEFEFTSLHQTCFTIDSMEYTYEFCAFSSATQRAKGSGSGGTSLGTFEGWVSESGNPHAAMKFAKGQHCYGGPSRSLLVRFRCGEYNEVTLVEEPSKCEYAMDFRTPLSCVL